MERHILDDLLLLVNVSLGKLDVMVGLQVEVRGELVRATDSLDIASIGLDIDDVSD